MARFNPRFRIIEECALWTIPSDDSDIELWLQAFEHFCTEPGLAYEGGLDTSEMTVKKESAVLEVLQKSLPNKFKSLSIYRRTWLRNSLILKNLLLQNLVTRFFVYCFLPLQDLRELINIVGKTKLKEFSIQLDCRTEDEYKETLEELTHLFESNLESLVILFSKYSRNEFEQFYVLLDHLHRNKTLISLEISLAPFNGVAEVLFSKLPYNTLRILTLQFDRLTSADLKQLCKMLKYSSIEKLNLNENNITDDGLDMIGEALKDSNVTHLYLKENLISGDNQFIKYLKNTKLLVLDLSSNCIDNGRMFDFPMFLKDSPLTQLDLTRNYISEKLCNNVIEGLKNSSLTSLKIDDFPCVLSYVTNLSLTNIVGVDLTCSQLTVNKLFSLATSLNQSHLKKLHLGFQIVSIESNNIDAQRNRQISYTSSGDPNGFAESDRISLSLFHLIKQFGDSGLKDFKITIRRLHLYPLVRSGWLLNESRDSVQDFRFTYLTHLGLSGLTPNNTTLENIVKSLQFCKLMTLDLSLNEINDAGAKVLASTLKKSSLIRLNLFNNNIGDVGLRALADGATETFLMDMNVKCNNASKTNYLDAITLRNSISAHKFRNFFKLIVPNKNVLSIQLERLLEGDSILTRLHQFFSFYKEFCDHKSAINVILADEDYNERSRNDIESIFSKFPVTLASFVARYVAAAPKYHVQLLKLAEELKLNSIVEQMLLNRPLYIIDKTLDILDPYVYLLLHKYKLPLCNFSVDPLRKSIIIDFFKKHMEMEGSVEVIRLLDQESP